MDDQKKSGTVDLALVHYPVCNKNRETIGSAVTNLDIHDIARAAKTFGLGRFYIVTPYHDQQQLVREIVDHWLTGPGGLYNPDRREALSLVRVVDDIDALLAEVAGKGQKPALLATCAREHELSWSYSTVRKGLAQGRDFLIFFGTGWGLTSEVLTMMDAMLPPVRGSGEYNHLSVRSAVAIVLDRMLGDREGM